MISVMGFIKPESGIRSVSINIPRNNSPFAGKYKVMFHYNYSGPRGGGYSGNYAIGVFDTIKETNNSVSQWLNGNMIEVE